MAGRAFDERSNQRIIRSVLRTEQLRPTPVRVQDLARQQQTAAGRLDAIGFQVVGGANYVVQAEVLYVPDGFSLQQVLGVSVNGTVNVYDPLGCYFNAPSAQLTGRTGWAKLMIPTTFAYDDPFDPNPYADPQWCVWALCCDFSNCGG